MKEKSRSIVITSYIMTILFLLSAGVQYNDPDSTLWIVIYGVAALTTYFFIRDKIPWAVVAVIGAVALIWAGLLGYDAFVIHGGSMGNTWQMQNPSQEVAREAGGMLVIGIWMLVMTYSIHKRSSRSK